MLDYSYLEPFIPWVIAVVVVFVLYKFFNYTIHIEKKKNNKSAPQNSFINASALKKSAREDSSQDALQEYKSKHGQLR